MELSLENILVFTQYHKCNLVQNQWSLITFGLIKATYKALDHRDSLLHCADGTTHFPNPIDVNLKGAA